MDKKCIIVGGGIVGMMTALELSRRQWDCTILEKGECGKESSWAGGGILSPLYPWNEHEAIHALAVYGQKFYPAFTEQIKMDTDVDAECIPSGMLYVLPDDTAKIVTWLEERKILFEWKDARFENESVQGIFLPQTMQIRPPRLNRGLKQWLLQNGITILENEPVQQLHIKNSRLQSIETYKRTLEADAVVIACGSWTNSVLNLLGYSIDIKPVKGQIIALQTEPNLLPSMMIYQSCYLIPRNDGLVLVGYTIEDQGFDKSTSEQVKQNLLHKSYKMCPALQEFSVTHHWAGLRPGTSRLTPYICKLPDIEGVYLNTGHFCCGLTLAPASARFMVDLMEEKQTVFDAAAFQY